MLVTFVFVKSILIPWTEQFCTFILSAKLLEPLFIYPAIAPIHGVPPLYDEVISISFIWILSITIFSVTSAFSINPIFWADEFIVNPSMYKFFIVPLLNPFIKDSVPFIFFNVCICPLYIPSKYPWNVPVIYGAKSAFPKSISAINL